jgi:hypothetical protein
MRADRRGGLEQALVASVLGRCGASPKEEEMRSFVRYWALLNPAELVVISLFVGVLLVLAGAFP